MDSTQQLNNVETVEIEEPSDKVQVLSDEKTCITRKHLYIIVGVLLVAAIALIGTLLGFTASSPDNGVNQDTLKLGVASTFPLFDANNDGYVDHNEMSNWMSVQLATCKHNCKGARGCDVNCGTQTSGGSTGTSGDPNATQVATFAEVNSMINPCDFDGDGQLSHSEMQACVIQHWLSAPGRQQEAPNTQAAPSLQGEVCGVPGTDGFPGNTDDGKIGACRNPHGLWCFTHFGCQDKRRCDRYFVATADTVTHTCCGQGEAANCTGCDCGATYTAVPAGGHPNLARFCHKLADFWCNDVNTHTKCH